MKVIFDSETDTLSIILRDEKIVKSDEVKDNVICCIHEQVQRLS